MEGTPADAAILTVEDDWRTVIKPRLIAHNAELSRVHRVEVHDEHGPAILTLPDDVSRLEAELVALRASGRNVAMLVVDPIAAFVSTAINTHADAPVRRALAPLAQMADRLDLAVVVVMHLTKDDSQRLMTRVGGSGAFVNAARSVLAMVRDPDDPDGEQGRRRLVLHAASNWGEYAPTLAVHMEGREVDTDDGKRTTTGYLVVDGESSVTVDDVQRGPDDAGGDAEELIAVALAGGPRPSRDVKGEVARELDCSRRTVERAAGRMVEQGELAIESSKFPRRTTWTLTATTPAVTTTSKAPRVATDQNGATEPNLARQEVQSRHAPPYGTTDATGATKDADDAPLDLLADYRRRRDGMLGERWDDDQ